jgi:uncharacterized protein (TIGR02996 family)
MNTKQDRAFLDAIIEDPEDDTPRLVYADWLDEQGDSKRAELIRLQIELPTLLENTRRQRQLEQREKQLVPDQLAAWCRQLKLADDQIRLKRGFPEQVTLSAVRFCKRAADLVRQTPGMELNLDEPLTRAGMRKLADCEQLRSVRRLNLARCAVEADVVAALLASKYLTQVRELNLQGCSLSDGSVLAAVAEAAPRLPGLENLDLTENRLEDDHLVPLLGSTLMAQLKQLRLAFYNPIGNATLERLAAAPSLARLAHLDMSSSKVTAGGLKALLEAPTLTSLKHLYLGGTRVGNAGARLLAESPASRSLRYLSLADAKVDASGASFLAQSRNLGQLEFLELHTGQDDERSRIGNEGLDALANTDHLPGLRHLLLVDQEISDGGMRKLVKSRLLGQLTWLKLNSNPLGDDGVKALAASPQAARLQLLDLYDCSLTSSGGQALVKSPHLKALEYLDLTDNDFDRKTEIALRARFKGDVVLGTTEDWDSEDEEWDD